MRLTEYMVDCWSVCMAAEGNMVYNVYMVGGWGYWDTFIRRSTDSGESWEPEVNLSNTYGVNSMYPSISVNGSTVHVAWQEYYAGNWEINYIRSLDEGSTWGPSTRLTYNDYSSLLCTIVSIQNYVHLFWYDRRDGNWEIYYKRSEDNGDSWGPDINLTNNTAFDSHQAPAVTNSGLFLTWQSDIDGNNEIYYKCSWDQGITWDSDIRLTFADGASIFPFIAVSGPLIHIAWQDDRDGNNEIYYKRNPTGGMVGMDEQLRAESSGLRVYPNPAGRQLTVGGQRSAVGGQQSAAERSDVPTLSGSAVRLSIVDLFGREVKSIGQINDLPYQIDISDLPDGVYILRMTDEAGNAGAVKFVKQMNGY